jgi:hypothetical protein
MPMVNGQFGVDPGVDILYTIVNSGIVSPPPTFLLSPIDTEPYTDNLVFFWDHLSVRYFPPPILFVLFNLAPADPDSN